jgi:uncharacterized membrane protein
MSTWNQHLTRWAEAGLIDADAVARIRDYESARAGSGRLRWPVLLAIAFGAVLLGGGVLLFVAAHWDALSPAVRFALVLMMVGGFHLAAAVVGDRVPHLSSALHGVGTIALGAGIALAGQIFNLDEHWPSGILMWAVGAGGAWLLLRQTPQAALLAILAPAWLLGEWRVATHSSSAWIALAVAAAGVCLTALTYFTLPERDNAGGWQSALRWVGGIALLPAALALAAAASGSWTDHRASGTLPATTQTLAWLAAFGAPLTLAVMVRGRRAWPHAAAALWIAVLLVLEPAVGTLALYPWWVLAAIGVVAWGVREGHTERVNMGAAIFAGRVMAFYFSQLMDKLGRSASLIGLGLLFLAGGWALERLRRRLVLQARGTA